MMHIRYRQAVAQGLACGDAGNEQQETLEKLISNAIAKIRVYEKAGRLKLVYQ